MFSDVQEFVQGIDGGAPTESAAGDAMDAAERGDAAPPPVPPPPGVDADADADLWTARRHPPPPPPPARRADAAPADRVNLGGIGEASTASKGRLRRWRF